DAVRAAQDLPADQPAVHPQRRGLHAGPPGVRQPVQRLRRTGDQHRRTVLPARPDLRADRAAALRQQRPVTMRILVDITHPAHAHFFRHAITAWRADGHEVLITSRDKDMTFTLLDEFGFEHTRIGRARRGVAGRGIGLAGRAWALNRIVRAFRPDVATAIAGTFIAYGCLPGRVPTVVF